MGGATMKASLYEVRDSPRGLMWSAHLVVGETDTPRTILSTTPSTLIAQNSVKKSDISQNVTVRARVP